MGRPYLGPRRQISLRLPDPLLERVDQARGLMPRDEWFAKAAETALTPIAQYDHPELLQEVVTAPSCKHEVSVPSRTEFRDGQRVRIVRCVDCMEEFEWSSE